MRAELCKEREAENSVRFARRKASMGQMKYFFMLLGMSHCATRYETPSTEPLRVRVDGTLTTPSICGARDRIQSRVRFDSLPTPCELDVQQDNERTRVVGECESLPREATVVALQYYVTATTGEPVILAETVARADFTHAETDVVMLVFESPPLELKTAGQATETLAERQRFNCDFGGENRCGMEPDPRTDLEQQDSCSNLQELCAGTLFTASIDQCSLE